MDPPPPMQLKVRVAANEEVARRLHEKRLSLREQPGGFKENLDRTFAKAYRNVCSASEPIRTLKDFSKINGVGPWLIRSMKGFFEQSTQGISSTNDNVAAENGKKTRGPRRCLPKKNTAASGSLGRREEPPTNSEVSDCLSYVLADSIQQSSELQSSGTMGSSEFNTDSSLLAMPPRQSTEEFLEAYEVVLILDDRESFGSSRNVADNIRLQFNVPVEVKRLPLGDGIWIARHRETLTDYVLDFIVERKNVSDLGSSIRDNRYKDQKLRLQNCGLRKVLYLVEGDPYNLRGLAASIETACFTTELLDGFQVLRTSGYADTERKYGYLTRSITEYYSKYFSSPVKSSRVCPTYAEFVGRCDGLKKKTVRDILALQLMQVPQVTEEAALAVVELFPTVHSLALAYDLLKDDVVTQENMLMVKTKKVVSSQASRNVFRLIWSDEPQSD